MKIKVSSIFFFGIIVIASTAIAQVNIDQVKMGDGTAGHSLQLVAGTITGSRTITVPDPGTNASVLLSTSTGGQTITGGLTVTGTVSMPATAIPVFGASGASHSTGAVPDPGAVAGTTHFLCEDGTWKTVSGGGGITTFGYTYELATIADATVVGGADVPFSNNGPLSSVTHTAGTTTITVPTSGTYEVNYSTSITSGVGSAIAIAVNGTVDASTVVPALVSTGEISGMCMLTLAAGDIITLRNNSATPFTMTLAPSAGSMLTIKLLS